MTTTETDRRAHANIINAPDPLAGIELVAAHREAACAKLREALERIASMQALHVSRAIDSERDQELMARIDHARQALGEQDA